MTMKTINVTELKAHLSKYLRMASEGSLIVVKDRNEPIAQLGPLQKGAPSWRERLGQEGRLRPGSQDWQTLEIVELDRRIDVQASLDFTREESHEVRRR
jgi:antitoxin (DNA-binding transcriptional repressor) of toxin-antitoxin stability system